MSTEWLTTVEFDQSTGVERGITPALHWKKVWHFSVQPDVIMYALVTKLGNLGPDIFKFTLNFLNVFDLLDVEHFLVNNCITSLGEVQQTKLLNTVRRMVSTWSMGYDRKALKEEYYYERHE